MSTQGLAWTEVDPQQAGKPLAGWSLDLSFWLVIVFVGRKSQAPQNSSLAQPTPTSYGCGLIVYSVPPAEGPSRIKALSLECLENKTLRCMEADLPTLCPCLGGLCSVWKEPWE